MSHISCHMSHVMCHMSNVACNSFSFFLFLDKMAELVGGGSVIKGAYPFVELVSSFKPFKKCLLKAFVQRSCVTSRANISEDGKTSK